MKNHRMFQRYVNEASRYELLSLQKEQECGNTVQHSKDAAKVEAAKQKLIKHNLRLVLKIAHDFKNLGLEISDLVGEGNIGLMVAAGKFDPSKGSKFSSYSAWWIKQHMRRALSNQSRTIRIPMQTASKIKKIQDYVNDYQQRHGVRPTDEKIAEDLEGITERSVRGMPKHFPKEVSLSETINDEPDGVKYEDILMVEQTAQFDARLFYKKLNTYKPKLDKEDGRMYRILVMRYGLEDGVMKTLDEVGKVLGKTKERVRQIQERAETLLSTYLEEDNLKIYDFYE